MMAECSEFYKLLEKWFKRGELVRVVPFFFLRLGTGQSMYQIKHLFPLFTVLVVVMEIQTMDQVMVIPTRVLAMVIPTLELMLKSEMSKFQGKNVNTEVKNASKFHVKIVDMLAFQETCLNKNVTM